MAAKIQPVATIIAVSVAFMNFLILILDDCGMGFSICFVKIQQECQILKQGGSKTLCFICLQIFFSRKR